METVKPPLLDPQTLRVVLIGGALLLALIVLDTILELTGHGGSPVAVVLTKMLLTIVGIGTTYLAGRSPGPDHAAMAQRIIHLELQADTPPTGTKIP
jgi:hypothetical protein